MKLAIYYILCFLGGYAIGTLVAKVFITDVEHAIQSGLISFLIALPLLLAYVKSLHTVLFEDLD
jgi:uncharacterized membrane protein (DUF485 family)